MRHQDKMAKSEPDSSSSGSGARVPTPGVRRRPIPRKGHKKPRAGCLVCKGRKVKCDEATPQCGPCGRLGLDCHYKPGSPDNAEARPLSRAVALRKPLRSTPTHFTFDDLRFFQHFLFKAYPSLPIDGWDVWQEIGRMSHDVRHEIPRDEPDKGRWSSNKIYCI